MGMPDLVVGSPLVNRLVRTRMLGGVGRAGQAPSLTRLGHFVQMVKIFNRGQIFCLSGLSSKKIPPNLKVQPKISGNPEKFCQPKSSAWCDAALLINELIHSLIRNMNGISEITLTDIHRHEELLPKHFAGMSRRPMRWNSNHIRYL